MKSLFKTKNLVKIGFLSLTLIIILFSVWIFKLDKEISERLKGKRFVPPLEFYSAPAKYWLKQKVEANELRQTLIRLDYRERKMSQTLLPGDFIELDGDSCRNKVIQALDDEVVRCFFIHRRAHPYAPESAELQIFALDTHHVLRDLLQGPQQTPVPWLELEPELFAQYYGNKPIIREVVDLGDAPPLCLQALLAIEDSRFLEHSGVSFRGIARAFVANIRKGRLAEGGSTITQQLVKNYFLTSEKTLRRKFIEVFMAMLLETRASKDDILETYINVIYLGQNGPFQVRGYGAAAEYYFGQSLSDLSLDQCSLLAALVNSPGLYSPFRNPERAQARRKKVLEDMVDLAMISEEQATVAAKAPLPEKPYKTLSEPAPYFVDAVRTRIKEQEWDLSGGAKIYTTLRMEAQEIAQTTVDDYLTRLEKWSPHIKKLQEEGKRLEGLLIGVETETGYIESLVGGRNFRKSQYNRALDGHRQVGSLMKPFVYLTALESYQENGEPWTPASLIEDERFTYEYSGQSWSPRNYGDEYFGTVPLYYALKSSLNCATAKLGLHVGLEAIIDVARRVGIVSEIQALPSLTLGAYELYPLEVVRAYNTLASMGRRKNLTLIRAITTPVGQLIYGFQQEEEQVFAPETVAPLIGMMKQTVETGTARYIRTQDFWATAAGKTGTTTDSRDAWFSGFTPEHLAVVWVGYDDNTSHHLTGASGAVPIWTQYMKQLFDKMPSHDFQWPRGTVSDELSPAEQKALGVPEKEDRPLRPVQLIFRRGNQP